ncbi:hypothetical protein ACFVQ4_25190 [Streptomyces laurentii]|uniref:hypothetical protein n=1 Tax=Streptomyces laurentii TaxID=39478 RepID=UPI003684449B
MQIELATLPGPAAAVAVEEGGELMLLLDPEHASSRLRSDLASILGHIIGNGLLGQEAE